MSSMKSTVSSMAGEKMLVNGCDLTVVYRPQPVKAAKFFDMFASKNPKELQEKQRRTGSPGRSDQHGLGALDRYEPELLGCYEHNGAMFSEVLEFLSFLINGEWRIPAAARRTPKILATSAPRSWAGGLLSPGRADAHAILAAW